MAGSGTPAGTVLSELGSGLRLWGYGEVYYTDPVNDRSQTQFDLARAVFGIGYRFDERTEFNSEYEVEHAVSSADDVGEFEVEQFYVDRRLNDAVTVRAGLFLMPFGLLNEHHEPTNFYGMQRNFVETLIIPSTWREGGFNLHGDTAAGFGWNVGLTTGINLADWDFAPEFPPYQSALQLENSGVAPLQATHQEAALANARYLTQYLALSYYGIPGSPSAGPSAAARPSRSRPRPARRIRASRASPCGRATRAGSPGAGTSVRSMRTARSATPPPSTPPIRAPRTRFRRPSTAITSRARISCGSAVTTGSIRSRALRHYNMGSSYQGTSGPDIPSGQVPLGTPGQYGLWPVNHDRVWTRGRELLPRPARGAEDRLPVVRGEHAASIAGTSGSGSPSSARRAAPLPRAR